MMLMVLSTSRFVAFAAPDNSAALWNLAFVHILEAIYLLSEAMLYGAGGEAHVRAVIFGNAVLFLAVAIGSNPSVASDAASAAVAKPVATRSQGRSTSPGRKQRRR